MSTKKINAGDTLTVGDLTDAHLGAVIEVGPTDGGITCRFRLDRIECYGTSQVKMLTTEGGAKHADLGERVKVITPPPVVVQPDQPKILGQCIRIEGDDRWRAVVAEVDSEDAPIRDTDGSWYDWELVLIRAGDRQIIVSDPPRWPDETPEADETLPEVVESLGQWHALPLEERRKFAWVTKNGLVATPVALGGWWYREESNLGDDEKGWVAFFDTEFPLTRGERVE